MSGGLLWLFPLFPPEFRDVSPVAQRILFAEGDCAKIRDPGVFFRFAHNQFLMIRRS